MQAIKMICWGLAGVYYYYQQEGYGNCSCTTYLPPEMFFQELDTERYQNVIISGAWVLDKSEAVDKDAGLVILSPLIDVNANSDSIEILRKGPEWYKISQNTWEKWDGNLTKINGWMQVGVNVYVAWWRKHGARIGKMIDFKTVEWET